MMRQPRKAIQTIVTLTIVLISTSLLRADLTNADFEAGGTGWTVVSDPFAPSGSVAHFANGYARLLESDAEYYPDGHNLVDLQQDFSRDASQTSLSFRYKLAKMRTEAGLDESDVFEVLIDSTSQEVSRSSSPDTVLFVDFLDYFNDPAQADLDPWKTKTVDLSSFTPGVTYTLTFRLIGDQNNHHLTSAFIDDVQLSGSIVPVPGAVLLGCIGLAWAGMRLRGRAGLTEV